jgi:hypothetical protein
MYSRPRAQHEHTHAISSAVSGSSSAQKMSLRLPPLQYLPQLLQNCWEEKGEHL